MKKRILFVFALPLITLNSLFGQITFQECFTASPTEKHEVFITNNGGYAIVGRKIIRINYLGDTLWTKSNIFGSSAVKAAVQTLDGGYAFSGYTNSAGIGLRDAFLIKTDSLGNIVWSKAYGGINHDEGYGLYQTSDSGFIISGSTRSVFPGSMCAYHIRTDLNGNMQWAKAIEGNERSETVIQTNDRGFILSGAKTHKLDSNGAIQWSKRYDGLGNEQVKCIRQTSDGGYILTGNASYFDSTNVIVSFLFKIDSIGALQWTHYYHSNAFTFGNNVEVTKDGGFIVAIQQFEPGNISDIGLIKTNAIGDTLWSRKYGTIGNDVPWSVKQTSDNGYVIAASTTGAGYGIYIIKTDSLGNSGCNQFQSSITIIDSLVSELVFADTMASGGIEVLLAASQINGTTVVPLCFSNTGLPEEYSDHSFVIHPNPAINKFILTAQNIISKGSIRVMSIEGIIVFEQRFYNTSEIEIYLNKINSGIYFVQIMDGQNKIGIEKLVVVKQ